MELVAYSWLLFGNGEDQKSKELPTVNPNMSQEGVTFGTEEERDSFGTEEEGDTFGTEEEVFCL